MVSASQRETVRDYIRAGIEEGARLVTGGAEPPAGLDRGYFVAPTVFSDVRSEMKIAQEEIFGPVLSIIPYDDEDDAVRIANDTRFGLSGAVWSADEQRAVRVARRLDRTGRRQRRSVQPARTFRRGQVLRPRARARRTRARRVLLTQIDPAVVAFAAAESPVLDRIHFEVTRQTPSLDHYRRDWTPAPTWGWRECGSGQLSRTGRDSGSPIHVFGPLASSSSGKEPARSWCWAEYPGGMITPEILDPGDAPVPPGPGSLTDREVLMPSTFRNHSTTP